MSSALSVALTSTKQRHPFQLLVFAVGALCMLVASFFLIEGLSQFSGSDAAKHMLIVAGVLFQITESVCFIAAAAFTMHSNTWRRLLFMLGVVLFCFSTGVMTFAQKAALGAGESAAVANDQQRAQLQAQIKSLDQLIAGYRANANKQSQSIYAASRALGEDSLNKAAELEEKKLTLTQDLFTLNNARRETSLDFFKRLEVVTGLPALKTEFWFLFLRSILLELSGIFLMSFSAHLATHNARIEQVPVTKSPNAKPRAKQRKRPRIPTDKPTRVQEPQAERVERTEPNTQPAVNVAYIHRAVPDTTPPVTNDVSSYADKIKSLYVEKKLNTLGQKKIISALREHYDISVGTSTASEIQKLVKQQLSI